MASGGYRPPGNTTDFLEEWKAKREKMRARFAAATGANNANGANAAGINAAGINAANSVGANAVGINAANSVGTNPTADPGVAGALVGELNHGGRAPAPVPRRSDEEGRIGDSAARNSATDGGEVEPPPEPPAPASPVPCPKNKEKKNSGPSARKGKGQIEKRKLREKRRSTGVVNIPSTESPDEENDPSEQKLNQREDATTQQNTILNESITSDTSSPYPGTSRTTSRWKSSVGGPEEEVIAYSTNIRYSGRGERLGYGRYGNSASSTYSSSFEKKQEEFEKELTKERQENQKLVKLLQDRDELIGKLKEEIDLLNRDLDEIEDENDQLKQENKTLLKVVGQLTR